MLDLDVVAGPLAAPPAVYRISACEPQNRPGVATFSAAEERVEGQARNQEHHQYRHPAADAPDSTLISARVLSRQACPLRRSMRTHQPLAQHPELIVIRYGVDSADRRAAKGKQRATETDDEQGELESNVSESLARNGTSEGINHGKTHKGHSHNARSPVTEFRHYRRKRRKRDGVVSAAVQTLLGWTVGSAALWVVVKFKVSIGALNAFLGLLGLIDAGARLLYRIHSST